MPNVHSLQTYLKVDHVKSGDVLKFVDAGQIITKDFKQKDGTSQKRSLLEIGVKIPNGEIKTYSPNSTSVKYLTEAFGPNTEDWVGKEARAVIVEQIAFGEIQNVLVVKP